MPSSNDATSLAASTRLADAEPLLLRGFDGLKKRAGSIPPNLRGPRLTAAAERLVRYYEATGKPDEAAKWKKELDALRPPAKK